MLFLSVIPVMWINTRRIQQERAMIMARRSSTPTGRRTGAAGAVYRFLRSIPTWVLWLLVIVWSIPTLGLLVNSVRTRDQQRSSGWWTVCAATSTASRSTTTARCSARRRPAA